MFETKTIGMSATTKIFSDESFLEQYWVWEKTLFVRIRNLFVESKDEIKPLECKSPLDKRITCGCCACSSERGNGGFRGRPDSLELSMDPMDCVNPGTSNISLVTSSRVKTFIQQGCSVNPPTKWCDWLRSKWFHPSLRYSSKLPPTKLHKTKVMFVFFQHRCVERGHRLVKTKTSKLSWDLEVCKGNLREAITEDHL